MNLERSSTTTKQLGTGFSRPPRAMADRKQALVDRESRILAAPDFSQVISGGGKSHINPREQTHSAERIPPGTNLALLGGFRRNRCGDVLRNRPL